MMDNGVLIFQAMTDFVFNNQMKIDKSTYFTVVSAQLTIYGIFLTFVQFIASIDSDGKNRVSRYLGVEVNPFYISKKLKLSKFIGSKIFLSMVISSFFIKPILIVFSNFMNQEVKAFMILVWYIFVIMFMILFTFIFVGCAKLIMEIKRIGQNSKYNLLLNEIEEDFIRNSSKSLNKENEVDKLNTILLTLKQLYEIDNNCDLLARYKQLTISLLKKYYKKKECEINLLVEKNICKKNQIPFEYNFDLELAILDGIIREELGKVEKDDQFIKDVLKVRMRILNKSIERKIINELKQNQIDLVSNDQDKSRSWEIYRILFESSNSTDLFKFIIEMLYFDRTRLSLEAKKYIDCKNRSEISILMRICLGLIGNKKMNENQFIEIFDKVLVKENYKETLKEYLIDIYIENNIPKDIDKLINRIGEHQKAYILTYLLIYNSLYDFRFEWKYFDIKGLKKLLPNNENYVKTLISNKEYIISNFENSMIEHRFSKQMIDSLIYYLSQNMNKGLIKSILKDRQLNIYYLFVYKIGVLEENISFLEYSFSDIKELNVGFLRFLSKHPELFEDDKFIKFLYRFRYNTFSKSFDIEIEFEDDFSCLILSDITITIDMISKMRNDEKYIWTSFSKYLLIKTIEIEKYNSLQDEKWIISNITNDYISSNKSIEMYVQDIVSTYEKYNIEFSYVKKEKISRNLYKWLMEVI